MPRNYRKSSIEGFRICNRCENELPATEQYFGIDKGRALGIAYECRECHKKRCVGRDKRLKRWLSMTDEQKQKKKIAQQKYAKTTMGRAIFLRKAYERIDACDMSTKEVAQLISKSCFYCDTVDYPRGLDRIDNNLPHVAANVVPCCAACNFARGDRLTVEEMKIVGQAIKTIYALRKQAVKHSSLELSPPATEPK